jgi:hypothetical protein
MRVPAYFGTTPQDCDDVHGVDIDEIVNDLAAQVDHWNGRGSGFTIDRVTRFIVCITINRPLQGSSYIKTPRYIALKVCTVNINKKHSYRSETALARKQCKRNNEKRATGGSEKHSHYIFTTLIHRSAENCVI